MLYKVKYIEQMEQSECGLACLAMLLNYHSIPTSLPNLRDDYGSTKDGMTFQNLFLLARSNGLEVKAFQINIDDLDNSITPAIIHWERKHFVILEKITSKHFIIVDPAEGRRRVEREEFSEKYSNYIMVGTNNPLPKVKSKRTIELGFLSKLVLKQKVLIFNIFLITMLLQVFAIITPIGTKWFTDSLFIEEKVISGSTISVLLLAIFLSYIFVNVIRNWVISKLQKVMDKDLMTLFIERLFRLPIQFFENRTSGDLLFRANSNIYIRQILSTTFVSLFVDIIMVVTYFFIMLIYSIKLSLYLTGFVALIILVMVIHSRILRKMNDKYVKSQTNVQSLVSESINTVSDIKVFGLEKKLVHEWTDLYDEQLKSGYKINLWNGFIYSLTGSVQYIIPLFIYGIGSFYVSGGEITVGTLIAFGTIASTFISPIITLGNNISQIYTIRSYLRRIVDVIESKSEQPNNDSLEKVNRLNGKIELSNVSYKFSKYGQNILNNINMTIQPGETIAIVGESGSGKSTLLKLILGLYFPTDGDIKFDNKSIKEYDIYSLRNQISSVLQESSLLNRTIRENLVLFDEDVSQEQIFKACYNANILEMILKLPMKFETKVSEQGVNFSGGQRQRLQIARALVKENPILVLDEATSSLDSISERIIERNINELQCTKIIVAHRLSTIRNADRIFVIANGQIVEEGTHQQLLNNRGEYYKLYENNYDKIEQ